MAHDQHLVWRKRCSTGGCIEVAHDHGSPEQAVHLRDSEDPAGPRLVFAPQAWSAFLAQVTRGIAR